LFGLELKVSLSNPYNATLQQTRIRTTDDNVYFITTDKYQIDYTMQLVTS